MWYGMKRDNTDCVQCVYVKEVLEFDASHSNLTNYHHPIFCTLASNRT